MDIMDFSGVMMDTSTQFNRYMAHLAQGLGHADRHAVLNGYCNGLMLPLSRKSVEPMAARIDPLHASARHQSLQAGACRILVGDEVQRQ